MTHTDSARDERTLVILPKTGRPESQFAEEMGRAIGPLHVLFRHHGKVVEILEDGNDTALHGATFAPLTPIRARTLVERYVITGIQKEEDGQVGFQPKTMSLQTAATLLESPQFLHFLPRIDRVLDFPIPIETPRGIQYPMPGYNPILHIYVRRNNLKITRILLIEAVAILERVLKDFCFRDYKPEKESDEQAKTHALARLITPYARGLVGFENRIPSWIYAANRPRAGKDYLAGIAQILFVGYAFSDAALGDPDETRKRITSALLTGQPMIHFTNCVRKLNDQYLMQLVTDQIWKDRRLGVNSIVEIPNEIDVSLSMNGDIGAGRNNEIEARSRFIELAFFEEDPNSRVFANPDLHGWILNNRSMILSAIHTIVDYWIQKGCPDGRTPFTSFPAWGRVVGGIMTCCGLGNPCLPHSYNLLIRDAKEDALVALYRLCYAEKAGQDLDKSQVRNLIIRECQKGNEELAWFGDLDSEDSKTFHAAATRLGKALRDFDGRIVQNIKLTIDKSGTNSARWKYQFNALKKI